MNDYYLQQINKLRLFDDDFMKIVFKDDAADTIFEKENFEN